MKPEKSPRPRDFRKDRELFVRDAILEGLTKANDGAYAVNKIHCVAPVVLIFELCDDGIVAVTVEALR